jgi:hypothetical protein
MFKGINFRPNNPGGYLIERETKKLVEQAMDKYVKANSRSPRLTSVANVIAHGTPQKGAVLAVFPCWI